VPAASGHIEEAASWIFGTDDPQSNTARRVCWLMLSTLVNNQATARQQQPERQKNNAHQKGSSIHSNPGLGWPALSVVHANTPVILVLYFIFYMLQLVVLNTSPRTAGHSATCRVTICQPKEASTSFRRTNKMRRNTICSLPTVPAAARLPF
jgi:hypothetical protein